MPRPARTRPRSAPSRAPFPRPLRACAQILSVLMLAGAAAFNAAPHAHAAALCTAGRSPSEAASLTSALSRASARVGDEHGLALIDLTTGVICGQNAGTPMITASIVKVSILGALLVRHQRSGTPLGPGERATAARMIEQSDNNAATALFNEIGGAPGLQRFFDLAGMHSSTARWAWGTSTTTPADQARLLAALATGRGVLGDGARDYELSLMRSVQPAQRWGVPYRAARGVSVAVKNGWLPTGADGWHINSLGVFTGGPHTYVMAVMTEDNPSENTGIRDVQTLAAAVNTTIMDTPRQQPATLVSAPAPGAAPPAGAGSALGPVPALAATTALDPAAAFNRALLSHRAAPAGEAAGAARNGPAARHAAAASLQQNLATGGSGPGWPAVLALLAMCAAGVLAGALLLRRTARTPAPDPAAAAHAAQRMLGE